MNGWREVLEGLGVLVAVLLVAGLTTQLVHNLFYAGMRVWEWLPRRRAPNPSTTPEAVGARLAELIVANNDHLRELQRIRSLSAVCDVLSDESLEILTRELQVLRFEGLEDIRRLRESIDALSRTVRAGAA